MNTDLASSVDITRTRVCVFQQESNIFRILVIESTILIAQWVQSSSLRLSIICSTEYAINIIPRPNHLKTIKV